MTILLRIAYEGTRFHGYAGQKPRPDGSEVRTVQGELERALAGLYHAPVQTRTASRTDAGVHAHGQLVALQPPSELQPGTGVVTIPPRGLARGLNSRLPADVRVLAAWDEPRPLDVRRDNEGKRYQYRIFCGNVPDPLRARFEWHLPRRLEVEPMRAAAQHFVGHHDFASFRAAACQAYTTMRTIESVDISVESASLGPMSDPGRLDLGEARSIVIDVRGQSFLHNMVRIMVGSLVEVGLGRKSPEWISELLEQPDRRRAGMTAPPQGLTLLEVLWPHAES